MYAVVAAAERDPASGVEEARASKRNDTRPKPDMVAVLRLVSTLHSALYTPHSTLHTLHFTLHALHFTLHTLHFTLYPLHSTPYTVDFTHYTLHSTLYTPHSTLHTPHSTLYTSHCALYTLHFNTLYFALHTLHFTLRTLHFTLHTLHFPLQNLHFTLSTPHFTLYTPQSPLLTLHITFSTQHSGFFTLYPLSTAHWYGNRGKITMTVQITCFTREFYVTALEFVGCILFFFVLLSIPSYAPASLPQQLYENAPQPAYPQHVEPGNSNPPRKEEQLSFRPRGWSSFPFGILFQVQIISSLQTFISSATFIPLA